MFGQRPNFGGASSSFGSFGTNTSTSGFGSSFGRPVFGAPQQTTASTTFGTGTSTGSTSLFGQNQTSGGGLFGTQATGFGSTGGGFGTSGGLFGSSSTQTSTTGLFGSTTSSGFNASQNQPRPFSFGTAATTSSGATGTSLFGTSSTPAGTSLFSSTIGQSPGTVVKYNPVTGTDTMVRSGVSQNISTKLEVITAMKEYETRSLEELRVEDYLAGRKGPQQQQGFGFGQQNKFMTQQPTTSSNWLSQNNTGGLFGAKPQENKPLFGTGQTTGFGTGATTGTGGLFGSTTPSPFGQSTTSTSTGFSFGQNTQNKPSVGFPFGQTTSTPSIFGTSNTSTQSGPTFGSTGFSFGNQTNQQGGGLFGSQNKPAFGGTNTSTSLFSSKPMGTTFGGFGTAAPNASPFGTPNTSSGGSLFGSTNQNKTGFSLGTSTSGFGGSTSGFGTGGLFSANNNQTKPGGLTFGSGPCFGSNTSSGGFSFNQPSTGGGLFNNPQGGGLFGNTSTNLGTGSNFGGGFGMNPLQPNLIGGQMNLNNNNVVNNNNINNLIKALTHNPFGSSSLLKSATTPTGKADELLNSPTNTTAGNSDPSKASVTDKAPTYVLPSASAGSSLKPKPLVGTIRSSNLTEDSKKNLLFAGLDDKNESLSDDPFKMKMFPNVKKLNLKVFKANKNSSGSNNSTGQNTATNSIVSGNLNSGNSTSPTNVPTSPLLLETPTNRGSLTPLHENSPTPDIIKGRNNLKHIQVASKNHLNDTMTDLNVMPKQTTTNGSANISDLESHEISKDNNISIFDPPSIDEIPDTSASAASPHPAGIKLTRAGYYTIPSMEDLGEMVDSDGSCLVENFTVGRYGYGNICFQGITNVAGIDLDACVFIVRKEVEVYPEGVSKPSPGEKLNKPAFITLDCVWPVDKSTHEVIKCQERLDAMGWPQYLEKQCMKMEATFVEYRPETGSWVFKVKHFSKYGLQEEENEPPSTAQAAQVDMEKSTGKSVHPPKESVMNSNEVPAKTPLSLANYPSPLPMFGGRTTSTQGPPAMALTSPPQHTVPSPLVTEAVVPVPVRRKVFLDGSSVEVQEDGFESVIKESDDSLLLWPLSPSAERLTLSSKAPPRAIQTLKSQLFFNDHDQEEGFEDDLKILGRPPSEKGEKREYSRRETTTPGRESSILGRISSKKIILGHQSFGDSSAVVGEGDSISPAVESVVEKPKKYAHSPSPQEVQRESEPTPKTCLREPRTEYQLLTSAPDPNFELGREVVSHVSESVPLHQSLISKVPRGIADAGCFMGRSFRVGWGPCLTLVHGTVDEGSPPAEPEEEREEGSATSGHLYLFGSSDKTPGIGEQNVVRSRNLQRYNVTIQKIHLLKDWGTDPKTGKQIEPMLEACLQNVLDCSVLESSSPTESNMEESMIVEDASDLGSFPPCPYFIPEKGINLLHRLSLSAAQLEARDETLSSVFDLCCALWGRLDFYSPDCNGESTYALEQARKEALSVWLEEVNEEIVEGETERALQSEAEEGYLDAVFSHLTARQISKACEVCQDKGDHHLALLLSQACLGDETPRQIMNEQLSNWSWSGLDAHMSFSRLALYTLLGGTPTYESSQGTVNTLVGLDWRRCVALFMWYMCPATSSIAEVISEYEVAAGLSDSKERSICEEPKPSYLANQSIPENVKVNSDVCFQLLKLYVDRSHPLEKLLETSAYTNDPMDVTASWLLWSILQSLDYTLLPAAKSEALHTSMAALLESHGSWHWAAFVTLCIPNETKRERDLMDLLSRHLLVEGEDACSDPFYREREQFILAELHIPEPFVHKAKAIRAKYLHLVDEEAWYLIQAGEYNFAHNMILDSIAPNAVINEDHDFLMSYLNEFLKREITEKVIDWQNGGDIYLAYLEVIQQVNELRKSRQPSVSKVEKLRPRLMALCLRLNNLKCPTAVHRLCISEMSRMVVSVLRAILSEDPEGIRVLAQQVSSLPLTHECALEELNHITHQYLTTLAHDSMETT